MKSLVWICLLVCACGASRQDSNRSLDVNGVRFWDYEVIEGVPNGPSVTYHTNGAIRTRGYFLNAEKHGLHVIYEDNGEVIKKVYFWHDVLVWETRYANEAPPIELLTALIPLHDPKVIRERFGWKPAVDDNTGLNQPPLKVAFVTTDRIAIPGTVVSIDFGLGGGTSQFTGAQRYGVFGKTQYGRYGGFFSLTTSRLSSLSDTEGTTLYGKRSLDVGATMAVPTTIGTLTPRLSFGMPLGGDDMAGYLANATTITQRPADVVLATPSSVALRGSLSWTARGEQWVFQHDLGFDQGASRQSGQSFSYARLNSAFGLDVRYVQFLVEFSGARRLGSLSENLYCVGVGAAVDVAEITLKGLLARTSGDHTSLSLAADYEF